MLDFCIVGAGKCGTTSLWSWLSQHPKIFMSAIKEPHYFCFDHPRRKVTEGWAYAKLFEGAKPGQLLGEASTTYLASAAAVPTIRSVNPYAKFIACIRNPIDLVQSSHQQKVFDFEETEADFETAWRSSPHNYPEIGLLGWKVQRLMRWAPGRVHVIVFDDLRADPHGVYANLCHFIGVDPDPGVQLKTTNARKTHAHPALARMLRSRSGLLGWAKRHLPYGSIRNSFHRLDQRPVAKGILYLPYPAGGASMSAAWISLREVEARPPRFPPGYLMAVFVGYGDESGKQDDPESTSSAYGILVGPDECWDAFDQAWNEALRRAGIDYFHRKEFGKPGGPYAHLDEATELQLLKDLVASVRDAGLEAYASAVRHASLAQFRERTGVSLDAYALSLYTCLGYIWFAHPEDEMTLYLDWVENRGKKFAFLQDYIATDPAVPELNDWFECLRINNAPKPKPGARLAKVPGYQAADFLAWETRKYVHTDPQDERHRKELDGLVHPMNWPPMRRRKSLHALNEAAPIRGTFWDVEVLENEHESRGGIWAPRVT